VSKKQPWERLPSEPNLWWCRFEAFRAAGPTRSLLAAYNRERVGKSQKEAQVSAPGSWRAAAKTYRWIKRAEAWDAFVVAEDTRRREEERQKVLQEGFALDHERVRSLKELANTLEEWVKSPDKVWLERTTENGTTELFNGELIKQLRGALDDIAAETGGRVKTSRNLNFDMTDWPDEAISRVAAGEDPIKVLASLASAARGAK
jgi:hypothetical protein